MRLIISVLCAANTALFVWIVWFSDNPVVQDEAVEIGYQGQPSMYLVGESTPSTNQRLRVEKKTAPLSETAVAEIDIDDAPSVSAARRLLPLEPEMPPPFSAEVGAERDEFRRTCYISESFALRVDAELFADSVPPLAHLSREVIPVSGARVRYWVAVSANGDFESASEKIKELENYGVKGGWVIPSGNEYVVSAGVFREKQAAEVFLDELRNAGFESSMQMKETAVEKFAVKFELSSEQVTELFERTIAQGLNQENCGPS